jgi:hypothetical protein
LPAPAPVLAGVVAGLGSGWAGSRGSLVDFLGGGVGWGGDKEGREEG